jgi:hypothetical protein
MAPKRFVSVKEAVAILDELIDDEEEIDMVIIPPDVGVVSDEEEGDEDSTESLNDLPSDVAGTIELDIIHSSVTDDVAEDNPSRLPVASTLDADDLDDVPLSRRRKTAPTVSQGQSSKPASKKSGTTKKNNKGICQYVNRELSLEIFH